MGGHHHRSGPLKQKNKQHKTGRHDSKTSLSKKLGGKIERVGTMKASSHSNNAVAVNQKAQRMQRQKQLRQNKREDLLLLKRFGSGSSLGPPKIVAVIALSELANVSEVTQSIFEGVSTIEEPFQNGLRNCTVGVFSQHKQKVCVIECGNDLLVSLDAAKVADIIVFVLPLHAGVEGGVNANGDKIISAIRAQGVPSTIGVIQGVEAHTAKMQSDLKKYGQRYFQTEFGDAVKVAQANVNSQLARAIMTMTPKTIHWREARSYMLATAAVITPNGPNEEKGMLQVSGYIRGKPLTVNQLLHITDVGTFQMSHIVQTSVKQVDATASMSDTAATKSASASEEQFVLATANPELQEDLRYEAEYDPFAAEQTWPTEEELADAERDAKKDKDSKGMSNYQAAWIDGDDEELGDDEMQDGEDDAEVDQAFCKTGEESVEDDDEDDISMDEDEDAQRERHFEELKEKRKQERENMTFPDEVDVPTDSSARVRFARYRGLKSLRTSAWDPKESLPADYSRLFQFEDFGMVQRMALERGKLAEKSMKDELRRKTQAARSRAPSMASAMEDVDAMETSSVFSADSHQTTLSMAPEFGSIGYVPSGVYVTIFVKDVPLQAFHARQQAGPLIMGALLKHENRLSVLNFSIQRAASFSEPLKSKEELVFHSGFRRFAAKPVYSDQSLKSDQHLFQRFLPQSGWTVASVYGPVTFQPASVLVFRESRGMEPHELVASGTLMNVNPDRIVLKRVVITGTPVKVKKRKAVVRYMFHSPEDIRWFKPVELVTKHGMTGHIKESLGTHGDFKAVFNKPVKQHDTVCLYLYKRVYPKFVN
uniref:Bms1-type G domain-containing protein n=1 Tax=Globisporangium ultimum (strain ATCC 200006 / CBS 805.95 / DAOM BR144) TaxID=431595 RepID=K3W7F2_GLOUD